MLLHLGKMTGQELADWFGITLKSYQNGRKNYLEKLEDFCEFNEGRGYVEIIDIYYAEYIKNLDNDARIYLTVVKQSRDHLCSISGIAEVLLNMPEFANCSYETLRKRMRKAGIKAFGVTKDEDSRGFYGSREYVWAIKLYDAPNHYRHFTPDEEKRFDEIISGFYTTQPERVKKMALLEKVFQDDDSMTKEEYFQKKAALNLDVFFDVIQLFKKETGLQVVHATAHDIDAQYLDSAF